MSYDVIIAGAGPAGTAAAITLLNRGRKVLLVDRQSFPRDKVCGDGVLPGASALLAQLGLEDQMQSANFYPIHGARIYSPNGSKVDWFVRPINPIHKFYIAPRSKFDNLLYQHAKQLGAITITAQVTGVLRTGRVVTGIKILKNNRKEKLVAPVVIGADGATSAIYRSLVTQQHRINPEVIAIRVYLKNFKIIPNHIEAFALKSLFPNGAWIFPTGPNSANVGFGIDIIRYQSQNLSMKELLQQFLNDPRIKHRIGLDPNPRDIKTWPYTLSTSRSNQVAYDGAVLVGDAAALMDPFTGEGIKNALLSGIIAGETISDALRAHDTSKTFLTKYEHRCEQEIKTTIRRSIKLKNSLVLTPQTLNTGIKLMNRFKSPTAKLFNRLSTNFEFLSQ